MNLDDFMSLDDALPVLSQRVGRRVSRNTATAWVRDGLLPAKRVSGAKAILIPKAALHLFEKPLVGANARRVNLARGIGIALRVLGETEVAAQDAVVGLMCPRCKGPWVIDGGIPVIGHERDRVCCNLPCQHIGPDFQPHDDPRVYQKDAETVVMRA